jgi:OmpA-OmpF porin, OOP family
MPRLAVRLRLSCALAAALSSTALAQPAGDIQLDPFRPAIDSRGYLTINASQTLGHKEVSFGLGSLSWGHKLLEFDDGAGAQYLVKDVITATLIGAFGVRVGPADLQFGASVPLTIVNGDRGPDNLGDPFNPNDDQDFKIDGQGIGNIGLHLKTRFLKTSVPPHVGVGVIASVFLPTATAERFMGEKQLTPQLMGIVDKEFGRQGRFRVAVNGGIRLRKETTFTDMGDNGSPATGKTITAAAELPFGMGFAYALSPQKFDLVGEVFGAIPLGNHESYQPLEAIGGVKLYLARNSFLSLGAGRGLITSEGGNPNWRAFIGIVFEPNIGDRDGDGLKDDVDKCPDDPEDRDRFEDEDGCPEPDNDRDTILDVDDKCPLIPEDRDGFQDEDGCPDADANDRDGDKILDNVDKCPDEPEDYDQFEDVDGCPDPDNDQDRILDVDDLCPNDPEDWDKFEDEDGCPDLDNDKDRILDKDDKCPNEPENYNNVEDDDGCPDPDGPIKTGETIIEILKPINFEFNKDIIKPDSFYILDAVIASLQGNPDILLMEIAGHTDERGDDAYNLDLSERRAAAVVKYLTTHGSKLNPTPIDPKRLVSQGYGETQPIDRRSTEQAWAKNRRVDFLILKRAQ